MKPNNNTIDRRKFLATGAAVAAAATLPPSVTIADDKMKTKHKICVFTKPFNSLSFDALADKIAELGFDGIEAPIRKGGHIETEAIADELPKLVEALKKRNLEITLATSDINDPDDPITTKFLRTLATVGVKRYRMKYFHYNFDLPVADQWAEWNPRFKQLAAMNHEYGIQGLYQNHSGGKYLGASIWDLLKVLDGVDPSALGVAYDIRHATIEAANSWPVSFEMIQPHMEMVYVKDFNWIDGKARHVPLGEGMVQKKFFELLAETGFEGPVSLHEEYLSHKDPNLVPEHWAAIKKDFAALKGMLKS